MTDSQTVAAHLASHPGTAPGLWQHPAVAGGRRLAAPSLQDVLAAMSPQLWDFRTNSTSSAETAEGAALQAMEGLTPTPASTPHQSPNSAPLGLGGQPAAVQSAPRQPALSQHPVQQRGALPSPSSLALEGDASAKKAAVRPRELRITATSGIGTLLEAINVLGASSILRAPKIPDCTLILRTALWDRGFAATLPAFFRVSRSLSIASTGVEKALNMPPPPLWRAPTPPGQAPTIGGDGAFVRPPRSDADGMARHHSADLERPAASRPRAAPAGGSSPVLPRRFSAEEVLLLLCCAARSNSSDTDQPCLLLYTRQLSRAAR